MKTESNILICYNAPVSIYNIYSGKPKKDESIADDMSETAFSSELEIIIKALKNNYTNVDSLPFTRNLKENITGILLKKPDAIFNLVESIEGISSLEAYNAGIYELLNIPYTGCGPQTLGNCLNKNLTKQILKSFNLNTPSSFVLSEGEKLTQKTFPLNFPVITKLLKEDASIGISENSVASSFAELKKQISFLMKHYHQDILIEEYIDGREFNVAVLNGTVLPISEILFTGLPSGLPKIVTYEGKWIAESVYYKHTTPKCPAKISKRLKKLLESTALAAFDALECRDYARVDIRVNKNNVPYIIEVNPNPDISTESGFFRAASAAGYSYDSMLKCIIDCALLRGKSDTTIKAV